MGVAYSKWYSLPEKRLSLACFSTRINTGSPPDLRVVERVGGIRRLKSPDLFTTLEIHSSDVEFVLQQNNVDFMSA